MLYWYNNYGDDMNIKKLVKVAVTVIIIVILGFLIKDNYYLLTNKIEYVYTKYLQGDIRQNLTDNKYRKKENYDYVKINENTTLKNKDDVKNMIYTYLDAGWDEYTVKCDADYLDCTNDIKEIVQNNTYLTDLSNFVHPFNTFDKINTTFAASGKVKLKKEPRYSDYVKGVVGVLKPDLVILVDALCSSSIENVNKSIQVTDNGISPGSGIGNKRKEISKETLNTKVISVGIPTVIDASTIVSDTINYMVKNYAYNKNHINDKSNKFIKGPVNYLNKETKITPADRKNFLGLVGALSDNEIKKLLYEVLTPIGYNLMVTPKEVDFILSKLSDVISYGINHSIHNI